MNRKEEIVSMSRPPQGVLQGKHIIEDSLVTAGQFYHIAERIEYPENGGILIHYKGMPFPKKGYPFPEAVFANDNQKHITRFLIGIFEGKETILPLIVFALLPWKLKFKKIEKILSEYGKIGAWMLNEAFLVPIRYTEFSREIGAFAYDFLISLGIDKNLHHVTSSEGKNIGIKQDRNGDIEPLWVTNPNPFGGKVFELTRIIATMIEYDDAYRFRLQDIFTESSKEALIENPQKEIKRLTKIFMQREKSHAKEIIKRISDIICLALYHPNIKKAFKDGLRTINFKRLQLDNNDRYHVLIRGDYDFVGLNLEDRKRIYSEFHMISKCHKKMVYLKKDKLGNTIGGKCTECFKELDPKDVEFNFPPMVEIAPN